MSKFLIVSKCGDFLGVALRMKQEGHDVKLFISEKSHRAAFKGILPQVKSWEDGLDDGAIVIFDTTGFGEEAELIKRDGYKTWGGGVINDKLEYDRDLGYQTAKDSGMKIPPYESFTSFDKARKYITDADEDKTFYFKPSSEKMTHQSGWTYGSKNTEDMIRMLNYFEKNWKGKVDFVIQEKIDGLQYSIEAWYCNGVLAPKMIIHQFETKKYLDGGRGVSTGCEATVTQYTNEDMKIYQETLGKMDDIIKKWKYNAPLDVNTIATKDGEFYFLEYGPRFGYASTYAILEGLNTPVGEYLESLANGEPMDIEPEEEWCGCVKVSIPPYPYPKGAEDMAGRPIGDMANRTAEDMLEDEHIWWLDVMMDKDGLACAGTDCVICEVTACGDFDSIEEDIYGIIDELVIPDLSCRSDGIKEMKERYDELEELGYFDEVEDADSE